LEALQRVLQRYQQLALNYLCRKFSVSEEEARDLWQGFILQQVLVKQCLDYADPTRGRFRSFMLQALNHYTLSELRRREARKRKPSQVVLPLHEVEQHEIQAEPQPSLDDETELAWGRAVIAGALLDMHRDCTQQGIPDVWRVFEARILNPILNDAPPTPYEELVKTCNYASPIKAANALVTAKRIFRRHLVRVISSYAQDGRSAAEELEALRRFLERLS
jgi:RNA polymerase sigma-70 factor (ECF subfamily)